jgi:hypothetical protein
MSCFALRLPESYSNDPKDPRHPKPAHRGPCNISTMVDQLLDMLYL